MNLIRAKCLAMISFDCAQTPARLNLMHRSEKRFLRLPERCDCAQEQENRYQCQCDIGFIHPAIVCPTCAFVNFNPCPTLPRPQP